MAKQDDIKPRELHVHIPSSLRGGVYANVTNANVNSNEVTLNFIYANGNDTPKGTMVSRVVMTRKHAQEVSDLLKSILGTANEVDPQ